MFQFPALASIMDGWYSFRIPGCPIRKSADQRLFAPTHGLSQLITSFIASESQGIRHVPLLTFFTVALRLDIYFQRFDFYLLFVHHVIERFPYLSKEMWRITDSNR